MILKYKCMISALYATMPSITITISVEAYRVLKAAKKDNESFSDVILRIFPRGHPRRILAYLKDHKPLDAETAESIREVSKELRRNFKARVPEI
jgi:predicted CopG family antitoxin